MFSMSWGGILKYYLDQFYASKGLYADVTSVAYYVTLGLHIC
jgi:hypothetical protein